LVLHQKFNERSLVLVHPWLSEEDTPADVLSTEDYYMSLA